MLCNDKTTEKLDDENENQKAISKGFVDHGSHFCTFYINIKIIRNCIMQVLTLNSKHGNDKYHEQEVVNYNQLDTSCETEYKATILSWRIILSLYITHCVGFYSYEVIVINHFDNQVV